MPIHPKREERGPEKLHHPSNWVPPLMPIYGPRAWQLASEVALHDLCDLCGMEVRALGLVCGGCHRVNPIHQTKLTAERRCDPLPEKKPAAKAKKARTVAEAKAAKVAEKRALKLARDRKRMMEAWKRYKGVPEADAWAARIGLTVPLSEAG